MKIGERQLELMNNEYDLKQLIPKKKIDDMKIHRNKNEGTL